MKSVQKNTEHFLWLSKENTVRYFYCQVVRYRYLLWWRVALLWWRVALLWGRVALLWWRVALLSVGWIPPSIVWVVGRRDRHTLQFVWNKTNTVHGNMDQDCNPAEPVFNYLSSESKFNWCSGSIPSFDTFLTALLRGFRGSEAWNFKFLAPQPLSGTGSVIGISPGAH